MHPGVPVIESEWGFFDLESFHGQSPSRVYTD